MCPLLGDQSLNLTFLTVYYSVSNPCPPPWHPFNDLLPCLQPLTSYDFTLISYALLLQGINLKRETCLHPNTHEFKQNCQLWSLRTTKVHPHAIFDFARTQLRCTKHLSVALAFQAPHDSTTTRRRLRTAPRGMVTRPREALLHLRMKHVS